jgi:hypothetical protein
MIILGAITAILASLLWLLSSSNYFSKLRVRDVDFLANLSCPKCGNLYGKEAAQRAEAEFVSRITEFREKTPNVKFYPGHNRKVVCQNCGAASTFNQLTRCLQLG